MNPLSAQEAFAIRCVLSLQPIPPELPLSPLVAGLLSTLDCAHNPTHRQLLENLISYDETLFRQVMTADPLPITTLSVYANAYINRVTQEVNTPPPDAFQANGDHALLYELYEVNKMDGPDAARRLWKTRQLSGTENGMWKIVTPGAYMERDTARYYDADCIVQVREVTAIIGQSGTGKSFWALSKLAELADDMPVLYVAAEGLNPARLMALQRARGKTLSSQLYIVDQVVDLTSDTIVDSFAEMALTLKPKVIVFDTFAACSAGIDENSSKDVQPVMNRIRERLIARVGCAVLLIHHTTKDGKSFRGSSALRGNVANMYYLVEEDGVIMLKSDKQRDAEPSETRYYQLVRFLACHHPETQEEIYSAVIMPTEKVIDDPAKALTGSHRKVLEALEPHTNGLTTRALQDATDISRTSLWRAITKLAKAGFIRTGDKGEPVYITEEGRYALFNHV